MAEIIDINVSEVVENIQITTTENLTTVNINKVTGSGANWGEIEGTLSNQTDLQDALDLKANESELGATAFSNDYNDLDNKPTIPTLTSQLTNDSGFITIDDVPTPDLSQLVPYTGATQDVDLGNNNLNAKGVKINGASGNGHLGLKHQSTNATAGGQETALFAGSDGELYYKNDGNSLAQIASRAWVNAQNYITNVITALGFTPENSANKSTSVITDSTSNTKYPTVKAVFDWANSEFKQYKFFSSTQSVGSNAVGETQLIRVTIPANTFSTNDKLYFRLGLSKVGNLNGTTIRVKLTTSSTMPSGATSQIASATFGNTILCGSVDRTMAISGGNLKGFPFGSSSISDITAIANAWSSIAFDVTQTQEFYVSATPATSTTDVTYLEYLEIKNM